MIGYVTLGTNNIEKAGAFYDALLGEMGAKRAMQFDGMIAWSNGNGPMLSAIRPYDKNAATGGNGTMVSLAAKDKEQVDAVYAKAMSLGATDEGGPGPRSDTFYAAYFRDLDGNKLACFFMG
jgi:predicted lactoylglutathione lyase